MLPIRSGFCFRSGRRQSADLLRMSLAFNWVRLQGLNLIGISRVSGAAMIHGCTSMCLYSFEKVMSEGYIHKHAT